MYIYVSYLLYCILVLKNPTTINLHLLFHVLRVAF